MPGKLLEHTSRPPVMVDSKLLNGIKHFPQSKCPGPTVQWRIETDVCVELNRQLCKKEDGHKAEDLVGTVVKSIESHLEQDCSTHDHTA